MKINAFLPMKMVNERFPNKNIIDFQGMPLFNHILKTISGIEIIDFVDVFASTDEYKEYLVVSDTRIRFVKRNKNLDSSDTSISNVIHEYCNNSDADLILMLHATSPMLEKNTILKCLDSVITGNFDSAATMIAIQEFAYFNDSPINFDPTQPLPRLQDIQPIFVEQNGLWVFKRVEFLNQRKRVFGKTYFHIVDGTEATDIDFKSDLDYLKYSTKDNSERNG
jgi:CMP-N-acetylneuraminic acid synthetase